MVSTWVFTIQFFPIFCVLGSFCNKMLGGWKSQTPVSSSDGMVSNQFGGFQNLVASLDSSPLSISLSNQPLSPADCALALNLQVLPCPFLSPCLVSPRIFARVIQPPPLCWSFSNPSVILHIAAKVILYPLSTFWVSALCKTHLLCAGHTRLDWSYSLV